MSLLSFYVISITWLQFSIYLIPIIVIILLSSFLLYLCLSLSLLFVTFLWYCFLCYFRFTAIIDIINIIIFSWLSVSQFMISKRSPLLFNIFIDIINGAIFVAIILLFSIRDHNHPHHCSVSQSSYVHSSLPLPSVESNGIYNIITL